MARRIDIVANVRERLDQLTEAELREYARKARQMARTFRQFQRQLQQAQRLVQMLDPPPEWVPVGMYGFRVDELAGMIREAEAAARDWETVARLCEEELRRRQAARAREVVERVRPAPPAPRAQLRPVHHPVRRRVRLPGGRPWRTRRRGWPEIR